MKLSLMLLLIWSRVALAAPVAVIDDLGVTHFFDSRPKRAVILSPGSAEIMFAISAESKLVAVSTYCDYPDAAKALPRVGDFFNPNLEAIMSHRPDVIVASGGVQRELVLKLRRLGVSHVTMYPHSMAGILRNIELLGRLFGHSEASRVVVDALQSRIDAVAVRVKAIPESRRPKVYFEMSGDPLMAIGGRGYVAELITLAGGVNIMRDSTQEYPRISAEYVMKANPDVIVLSRYGMSAEGAVEHINERPGWDRVAAVRSGRVYADLNMDLFMRPGPRLVDALEQLFKCFYGDR